MLFIQDSKTIRLGSAKNTKAVINKMNAYVTEEEKKLFSPLETWELFPLFTSLIKIYIFNHQSSESQPKSFENEHH